MAGFVKPKQDKHSLPNKEKPQLEQQHLSDIF